MSRPSDRQLLAQGVRRTAEGFTLVEVMVAITILAVALMGFLSTRSTAMSDAIQARNWRLARSIAEEQLSKLQAGANEFRPDPVPVEVQGYPGFRYVILIGEQAIATAEAEIESSTAQEDTSAYDRRNWQRERDEVRTARQKGLSLDDFRRQQLEQSEQSDAVPSEDDIQDVAVVVYFPNVSLDEDAANKAEESFLLKAKASTLAINGLTPEQADGIAAQKGVSTGNEGGAAGAANGGAAGAAGGGGSKNAK